MFPFSLRWCSSLAGTTKFGKRRRQKIRWLRHNCHGRWVGLWCGMQLISTLSRHYTCLVLQVVQVLLLFQQRHKQHKYVYQVGDHVLKSFTSKRWGHGAIWAPLLLDLFLIKYPMEVSHDDRACLQRGKKKHCHSTWRCCQMAMLSVFWPYFQMTPIRRNFTMPFRMHINTSFRRQFPLTYAFLPDKKYPGQHVHAKLSGDRLRSSGV